MPEPTLAMRIRGALEIENRRRRAWGEPELAHQNQLASLSGVTDSDFTKIMQGASTHPAVLANIAAAVGLDPVELLLSSALEQCPEEIKSAEQKAEAPKASAHMKAKPALLREGERRLRAVLATDADCWKPAARPLAKLTAGLDRHDVRTVLVGDKRDELPQSEADVLVEPASTLDLAFLPAIGLHPAGRIRSDHLLALREEKLSTLLHHDLLVMASGCVSLAARAVNLTSAFQFCWNPLGDAELKRHKSAIEPIKKNPEALRVYRSQQRTSLIEMSRHFIGRGLFNPLEPQRHFHDQNDSRLFGVLSLALNPWSEDHVVIFAAGSQLGATIAALKLLAKPDVFADHPLGGIFSVPDASRQPFDERYLEPEPTWAIKKYTIAEYEDALAHVAVDPELGARPKSVAAVSKLIGRLRKRESERAAPRPAGRPGYAPGVPSSSSAP